LSEYQKAIQIKPDYSKGHFNLGFVYYRKGKLEEAIISFQRTLEIQPQHPEAHYNLALIYYEKGEFKLAIQHSDQAAKLGKEIDPKLIERLNPYR
jgi:tetratricopeptide (TPR) repeat protein